MSRFGKKVTYINKTEGGRIIIRFGLIKIFSKYFSHSTILTNFFLN